MKKTVFVTIAAGLFLSSAAFVPAMAADPISAPPQISEADAQSAQGNVNSGRRSSSYEKLSEKARQYEVNPDLAPTDADYAKARKDREEDRINEATIQRMEEQYKNQSGEKHGDGEAGCESEKKAAGQADINTFEGRIQNFRERLAKAKEAGKDYFVMSYHINTTSYEIKN